MEREERRVRGADWSRSRSGGAMAPPAQNGWPPRIYYNLLQDGQPISSGVVAFRLTNLSIARVWEGFESSRCWILEEGFKPIFKKAWPSSCLKRIFNNGYLNEKPKICNKSKSFYESEKLKYLITYKTL